MFLPIKAIEGWIYSSVVKHLLSMCKALRSTFSTICKKKKTIIMDCFVEHVKQCEQKIKINKKLIIHG